MEYTFKTDFITGLPIAQFSYGHEAFGPWIEQEVGKDSEKLQSITDLIRKVKLGNEICKVGKEYTLTVSFGEVEVSANANNIDELLPEHLENDVDGFERNSVATCGVEDFLDMLASWQEFN